MLSSANCVTRCFVLCFLLVVVTASIRKGLSPHNAKNNPQLSRALLKLQRLLVTLSFEELEQQNKTTHNQKNVMLKPLKQAPAQNGKNKQDDDGSSEEDSVEISDDYDVKAPNPFGSKPASVCVESECPTFNCSSEDQVIAKTVREMVPMLANEIRKACGKEYTFSTVEMSFDAAGLACCKENMSLVSIESAEEYNCLVELYKGEMAKGSLFWTSGQYLGCPNSYRWCGSMQRFQGAATWKYNQLKSQKTLCVAASFLGNNQMNFVDVTCNTKRKFICESDTKEDTDKRNTELQATDQQCKVPNCPEFTCQKSEKALEVNNEYDQVCGKRYVLMEKQMNYLLAQVACCEIGMRLLSVETLEEQKCLEKTYSTRIANNGCVWTSGTDLGCEGRYRWCGSNASMYTSSNLAWMSGEPNDYLEDEDCLVLWNFNGELKLNDELCLEPFSFICEDIDDPKKASPQDSRPPDFINKIRPR